MFRTIISLMLLAVAVQGYDLSCYATSSSGQSLPNDATNTTVTLKSGACYKGRYIKTLWKTNGGVQSKVNETVSYGWGAVNFENINDAFTCQDNWQTTSMEATSSPELTYVYYSKLCFCCGELCNNATMDLECNEQPKFTKYCHGSQSKKPELGQSVNMPATDEMSCNKVSYNNSDGVYYTWGSNNIIPTNSCGQSEIFQGTEKLCTCCGYLCNDETMDLITADNKECNKIAPLTCYTVSYSKNSKLPVGAPTDTVSLKSAACYKRRTIQTLYNTTDGGRVKVRESVSYAWGYTDLTEAGGKITCRSDFEQSSVAGTSTPTLSYVTYSRTCFCCGDNCNGAGMDSECSENPVFIQVCNGGYGTYPKLNSAIVKIDVPATPTMSCFKSSYYDGSSSNYVWGASSIARIDECGQTIIIPSDGISKVCTCCGEKCNDESMDPILASNTQCIPKNVVN